MFSIGDYVIKDGGDYTFEGVIVCCFTKISGAERYVVENSDGVLFIMNAKMIRPVQYGDRTPTLP